MANGRGVRPKSCRVCGRPRTATRQVSFRGLCSDCAIDRQTFAALELHAKAGPSWDRWQEGMRAHARRVLDELEHG